MTMDSLVYARVLIFCLFKYPLPRVRLSLLSPLSSHWGCRGVASLLPREIIPGLSPLVFCLLGRPKLLSRPSIRVTRLYLDTNLLLIFSRLPQTCQSAIRSPSLTLIKGFFFNNNISYLTYTYLFLRTDSPPVMFYRCTSKR